MESAPDWRVGLSSLDRLEAIQKITTALLAANPGCTSAAEDAVEGESRVYDGSTSLEEYKAACESLGQRDGDSTSKPSGQDEQENSRSTPESPGITIGSYTTCHHVAGGVTAEVYKSKARALKVITEPRTIEPHNPAREAKILDLLQKPCIPLLETFRDQEQRFVLVFPYMPLSLDVLLSRGPLAPDAIQNIFMDVFTALRDIHAQGIIHRDVKPSAVLLQSPKGPAYLSDFGTAWHPTLSAVSEPPDSKILDIGTGPYRAPEALFGNKSYSSAVDMWAAGCILAESSRDPPRPLFESRPAHEDGNQLGLILDIFKTLGSPTLETWPEAASFRTPPFDIYQVFRSRGWDDILAGVPIQYRDVIVALVAYESDTRATAEQALQSRYLDM